MLASFTFVLIGVNQARAEGSYERGLWYDVAGILPRYLGTKENEADKLYNQGVRRVHIMINESIFQKAVHCECTKGKVLRFMYGDRSDDEKVQVTQSYQACLEQKQVANRVCAFASAYRFEFDKWGPQARFNRLDRFIKQLNDRNIEVILTIWPEPTRLYSDSLSDLTRNFILKTRNIYAIELEDEENWTEVFTSTGAKTELDKAAHDLVTKLRAELPNKVKIGVTTAGRGFTAGREIADPKFRYDALLNDPRVDYIAFQAYQDTHVTKDSKFVCSKGLVEGSNSPDRLASAAVDLMSGIESLRNKNLILGLSAYQLDCSGQQQKKGVAGTINMYKAAKQAICAAERSEGGKGRQIRVIGDAYFSEANVTGQRDKGNLYAHNFLSLCRASDIRAHCDTTGANTSDSDGKLTTELADVCPDIWKDLENRVVATPGGGGNRESDIYIYGRNKR